MPLATDTLADRVAASRRQEPNKRPPLDCRALLQGTCLVLIEAAGFAASSILLVLGAPLFLFLFLAGWDLALLFAQLGNLADHYRDAEPLQRLAFGRDLKAGFLIAAGALVLIRLPGFLRRLGRKLDEKGDRDD
ncbi:MAG: hypothetical protein J0I69_01770 [Altererythrobacter sp.]|nr:hypothetical protein [Altererythrobacter sp.]